MALAPPHCHTPASALLEHLVINCYLKDVTPVSPCLQTVITLIYKECDRSVLDSVRGDPNCVCGGEMWAQEKEWMEAPLKSLA